MRAYVFALLPILALVGAFDVADEFDVPIVLDTSGVPECIQTCLSELFYTAAQLIHLHDPVLRFRELCRSYENATSCIDNQTVICSQANLFDVALSGLDELCNEKEEDILRHKDCLSDHSEVVLKSCDSTCLFTDVMLELSGRGNAKDLQKLKEDEEALMKELASVCTAFGCMSSCVALDLNVHCSPVGTIITEALLKPFFTASTIFEEIGIRSKISIYRQIPPECYYLISFEQVQGIVKGKAPSKILAKNPEDAILKEIADKEEKRKKKKAELEKKFLLELQTGG